ncbi:MAG TPA: hypothetical protein VMA83_06735 [Solirubrobacteraceae bacterium]|nr:hypothetical protein [Solirubrobacteraceae bacterium]
MATRLAVDHASSPAKAWGNLRTRAAVLNADKNLAGTHLTPPDNGSTATPNPKTAPAPSHHHEHRPASSAAELRGPLRWPSFAPAPPVAVSPSKQLPGAAALARKCHEPVQQVNRDVRSSLKEAEARGEHPSPAEATRALLTMSTWLEERGERPDCCGLLRALVAEAAAKR